MVARCLFACCLVAQLFHAALSRRSLTTIRYHFTPCGASGRDGPSYEDCISYYSSVDSPLLRDGAFTDEHSRDFVGSQSFRPPRRTTYNLTIAAAAGGRGLCNLEFGRGLRLRMNNILNSARDYLILVGQKGLGPCDSDEFGSDVLARICRDPPRDEESADQCRDLYVEWLRNQSNLNTIRTLGLGGGAGGGGASYIGTEDVRLFGDARVLGIAGGGGGSSALLNYNSLDNIVPGTSEQNITLYRSFINGNRETFDPDIADNFALSGYSIENTIIAGVGAGFFENSSHTLHQQDGRSIGRIEDFAIGGLQCSRNDFSQIPLELRYGDGGFGGGGGGCGGGGGGGGVTGGAVLAAENTIPGGGGYTITNKNLSEVVISFDNEGEGYIDIVPTDCGCSYQCVVYEEEDQFQCLCPNYTQLAPDLSDCYLDLVHSVSVSDEEALILVGDYHLRLVKTGNTTVLYSLATLLQSESEEGLCAVAFLGDTITNVIAVTEPIQGRGTARNISLTTLNETDGSFLLSDYITWLSEPQIVTGALLIGTHNCLITDDIMNLTVSVRAELDNIIKEIESLESGGLDAESAVIRYLLANNDTLQNFINAILMQDTTPSGNDSAPLLSRVEILLIIISGSVAGCLCSFVLFASIICTCRKIQKRRKGEWSPSTGVPSIQAAHSTSTLLSNHAYGQYSVAHSRCIVHTQPKRNKRPSLTSTQSGPQQHEYDVLSYSKETGSLHISGGSSTTSSIPLHSARSELRDAVFESSTVLSPKFGHSAPFHSFFEYNRARADSESVKWQYPRSSLVYLRELGEGQFGKVLLMKTQGIAGYKGSIPVAVKTLSSREPEIIRKFMEEAELMKKFSHPNIVSILGVCTDDVDETSAPLMVMEYMQFGDLLSFLQTYKPTNGATKTVIKEEHFFCFASDVAQAMEFLANSKFVHRDIAARNCLVGTNLVVKIADFGLARGVHDKDYYQVAGKQVLPIRTMSPESLLYGVFTTASDVWSYGVLLWEVVTYGAVPLMGYSTEDVIKAAHNQSLTHTPPSDCPPLLTSLIAQCHNHDPDERPSFTDILSQLPT